jgi:hypothetical protein
MPTMTLSNTLNHGKRTILDSHGGGLSHAYLAILLVRLEVAFPEEGLAFRALKINQYKFVR